VIRSIGALLAAPFWEKVMDDDPDVGLEFKPEIAERLRELGLDEV